MDIPIAPGSGSWPQFLAIFGALVTSIGVLWRLARTLSRFEAAIEMLTQTQKTHAEILGELRAAITDMRTRRRRS